MWFLLTVAGFALAVIIHGLSRLFVQTDSVRRFLMSGAMIGILLIVIALRSYGLSLAGFAAIALYAFLCELYIFSFTLAISSISATILINLRQGPMTLASLSAVYRPDEMVRLRVRRLLKSGIVELSSERLVLTKRGHRLHTAFSYLNRFFWHPAR